MARSMAALSLVLPLCVLCVHCKKSQPHAASTPGGSTSTGVSGGTGKTTRDAGARPTNDDDAGGSKTASTGGALLSECMPVSPTSLVVSEDMPNVYNNAISVPTDFMATRVIASWTDECPQPSLRIELSDIACGAAGPHQALVFTFDAKAIEVGAVDAGALTEGLNYLHPDPESGKPGISIRYLRSATLRPKGTWGTCAGATGTLSIAGPFELKARAVIQGRFDLHLTDCGDPDAGLAQQDVSGAFNVMLRRGLSEVCTK